MLRISFELRLLFCGPQSVPFFVSPSGG